MGGGGLGWVGFKMMKIMAYVICNDVTCNSKLKYYI